MSEALDIEELRAYLGPHPERYSFEISGAKLVALLDAADAAQAVQLDDAKTPELWERMEKALDKIKFERGG